MKRNNKIVLAIILSTILLLAWAPWATEEYAINKVTEKLGGPNATFNYLHKIMPVKDIPKKVAWFPFIRAVYFPSEAVWFVTFYGKVL